MENMSNVLPTYLQRLFHLTEKPAYETIKALTAPWQPYAGFVYFHLLLNALEKKGILLLDG